MTNKMTITRRGDNQWLKSDVDENVHFKEVALGIENHVYDNDNGIKMFQTISAVANFDLPVPFGFKLTVSTEDDHLSIGTSNVYYYDSFNELKVAYNTMCSAITLTLQHTIEKTMVYAETYRTVSA